MPRFAKTHCSQCGLDLGPGDHGLSHCSDHRGVVQEHHYAIGRLHGGSVAWLGVVQGAGDAIEATRLAQRELGDPGVVACPWALLSRRQRELAQAGRVIEAAGP